MFKTNEDQKNRLYKIATVMNSAGIDASFISDAVTLGEIYEGAYDIFCLWEEEVDKFEKQKIISDLKNEIREYKAQVEHK